MIPEQSIKIVVATKPVDFRKGHDGLAAVVQKQLGLDPHSGVAVVFRSKRGDRIKVDYDIKNVQPRNRRVTVGRFQDKVTYN